MRLFVVATLICALCTGTALAEPSVDDVYHQGIEAFRAGDFSAAIDRFDAARKRIEPGHALYAPIHYNLGRCAQLMLEKGDESAPVCDGARWFEMFLKLADDRSGAARDRARAGRQILSARCAALSAPVEAEPPTPPPTPVFTPPPPDSTRWWLAGGAGAAGVVGAIMLALAAEADGDADEAYESYRDAETEAEGERWGAVVRGAEDEARTRSIIGLSAAAAAIGLGIGALMYTDDDAEVSVGPGHVQAIWRW